MKIDDLKESAWRGVGHDPVDYAKDDLGKIKRSIDEEKRAIIEDRIFYLQKSLNVTAGYCIALATLAVLELVVIVYFALKC